MNEFMQELARRAQESQEAQTSLKEAQAEADRLQQEAAAAQAASTELVHGLRVGSISSPLTTLWVMPQASLWLRSYSTLPCPCHLRVGSIFRSSHSAGRLGSMTLRTESETPLLALE